MESTITVQGCEVYKVEFNEDGSVHSFCLKAGRIYIPFDGEDAKRLTYHDYNSGNELLGVVRSYRLCLEGMDFTEEFKFLSRLIGVDWFEECLNYVIASDDIEMNTSCKEKKDNQRANMW